MPYGIVKKKAKIQIKMMMAMQLETVIGRRKGCTITEYRSSAMDIKVNTDMYTDTPGKRSLSEGASLTARAYLEQMGPDDRTVNQISIL